MRLRSLCVAATMAAFPSAVLGAGGEPHLDVALQWALSRYSGDGLPRACERASGCASGESLAAQLGVRVAEGFDALLAFRRVWADHPGRIVEPTLGVAWWPSEGIFATRVYIAAGLLAAPGTMGFHAQLGGDLMVFPVKFFGVGLAGEIAPVGFFGGSTLRTTHLGAAVHVRM